MTRAITAAWLVSRKFNSDILHNRPFARWHHVACRNSLPNRRWTKHFVNVEVYSLEGSLNYSETRLLRTLKGNEKRYVVTKVRSIQNAIFLTGRTGSTCSREQSATEDASPSRMLFIIRFSNGEIAFQGIVNLKTCREIEIETEKLDDMLVIRKKKNQRKSKKYSVHRRTCFQHICTHTRSHAPSIPQQTFCCFLCLSLFLLLFLCVFFCMYLKASRLRSVKKKKKKTLGGKIGT